MPFDPVTGQIPAVPRPPFIITDQTTMNVLVASLHHRIPWSLLLGTINHVLAGNVDTAVIRSLLRLSPGPDVPAVHVSQRPAAAGPLPPQPVPTDDTKFVAPLIKTFKTAVTQLRAKKTLTASQIASIDRVEELIHTLPCNLFPGANDRADDPTVLPGTNMDFLPSDIQADGRAVPGVPGRAQKLREQLFNRLVNINQSYALADIETCCTDLAALWSQIRPAIPGVPQFPAPVPANLPPPAPGRTPLQQATPFNLAQWVMGAGVVPGYRTWGATWTAANSNDLTAKVMKRVNKG